MIKKLVIVLAFAFLAAGGAPAAQFVEREFSCPVCRQVFYAKLDASGARREIRLDLKPVGGDGGPWLLPVCPKCGFVIYKTSLKRAELATCKFVVASKDYKSSLKRSSYFRVGLLYEKLGEKDFNLANTFLKASWQEESDPVNLKEDLERSLKYFTSCSRSCGDVEKENSRLLMGEILRRLGRFEEARAHLSGLQGLEGFQNNFFADIVTYQLKLCSKKDSSAHDMEDVRESKKPFGARMKNKIRKFFGNLTGSGQDKAK